VQLDRQEQQEQQAQRAQQVLSALLALRVLPVLQVQLGQPAPKGTQDLMVYLGWMEQPGQLVLLETREQRVLLVPPVLQLFLLEQ
jgi:hypothetical protein